MQQAQFRFYAELNDLLAPQRRGRSSVYTFGVPPSLKDAVEACLVPHTEVDLILANGEAAAFSRLLRDGDSTVCFRSFVRYILLHLRLCNPGQKARCVSCLTHTSASCSPSPNVGLR